MKFSEQWLREWVNPDINRQQLAHQLTMAGLEVEAIEPVAADFTKVVVAEVVAVSVHPNADKLRLCRVDVGEKQTLSIVCGAANVRSGLKVPAALLGATLAGGLKIKKSTLRGVESFGMLCSAAELGLASSEHTAGLMELPTDAPLGDSIRDYLKLDDVSIELGLTPNRGDCLSLQGIAREVGVLNRIKVNTPTITMVSEQHTATLAVKLDADKDCPHYSGRIIKNVNLSASTPIWLQERLRRSGLRSINAVVDVTNYVLLELGQPMHAFDLAKINGGIQVRHAQAAETISLLDGQQLTLKDDDLLIADHSKPLALAGIMGGADSAVTDTTCDIFLESAYFDPQLIAGRARGYGLHTDSSHRYERGVATELQISALQRASELLLAITGGQAGPISIARSAHYKPARATVTFAPARFKRVMGITLADSEILDILTRLEMNITQNGDIWSIQPPEFRFDISIEEDLIEEIGRIYGYEQLPSRPLVRNLQIQVPAETTRRNQDYRQVLVDRGYLEAITYSFVDEKRQRFIDPTLKAIKLANPISEELAVMRTSLWPGLLQAVQYNLHRQQSRIKLFECGLKFVMQDTELQQIGILAGVITGSMNSKQWAEQTRAVDYFDIKGDVECLLARSGRLTEFEFVAAEHAALHPGQAAAILHNTQHCGWLGALHPALYQSLGLTQSVYCFELEMSCLRTSKLPVFHGLSKFPAIQRDIAIVVEESITAQDVLKNIQKHAPSNLTNVKLFDVYSAEGIDSGRKSLALGLTLQDLSRTLTDREVETIIKDVLDKLGQDFGATLRE